MLPTLLNMSANPAPRLRATPVTLSYDQIRCAARTSTIVDMARQLGYSQRRRQLRETGADVQIISVPADKADLLVKQARSRLLKEHSSASWGAFFYQSSIFGLTGVSSIGTALLFYLGIYHNRMFLPVAPIGVVVTWRLWTVLEVAWGQQRYLDNAAQIREDRRGNPMRAVIKRRKKRRDDAGEAHDEDSNPGMGGASDML